MDASSIPGSEHTPQDPAASPPPAYTRRRPFLPSYTAPDSLAHHLALFEYMRGKDIPGVPKQDGAGFGIILDDNAATLRGVDVFVEYVLMINPLKRPRLMLEAIAVVRLNMTPPFQAFRRWKDLQALHLHSIIENPLRTHTAHHDLNPPPPYFPRS
ncbi:hypothetical protein JCM6882_003921 [Rhodosporidiobolus microsporus]